MKESLYSKLFKLFQLDSYFRHAALVAIAQLRQSLKLDKNQWFENLPGSGNWAASYKGLNFTQQIV